MALVTSDIPVKSFWPTKICLGAVKLVERPWRLRILFQNERNLVDCRRQTGVSTLVVKSVYRLP